MNFGFFVQQRQLSPDLPKIQAVAEWPTPSTWKQLQRFLRFANFNHHFIRDYRKVVAPVTKLTSSLKLFAWTEEVETAFSHLKVLFTTAPVLSHTNTARQFIVEVDASDMGVGTVLL